jgi:hypothetical protein
MKPASPSAEHPPLVVSGHGEPYLFASFYRAPLVTSVGEELSEMTALLQGLAQEYRRPRRSPATTS